MLREYGATMENKRDKEIKGSEGTDCGAAKPTWLLVTYRKQHKSWMMMRLMISMGKKHILTRLVVFVLCHSKVCHQ